VRSRPPIVGARPVIWKGRRPAIKESRYVGGGAWDATCQSIAERVPLRQ